MCSTEDGEHYSGLVLKIGQTKEGSHDHDRSGKLLEGGTEEIDEEDVAVRFGGNIQVRTGRHGNAIAGPQSALGLAGFLLTVTLIFHTNLAKQQQPLHFLKNIAVMGGLLLVMAQSAGGGTTDGGNDGEPVAARAG